MKKLTTLAALLSLAAATSAVRAADAPGTPVAAPKKEKARIVADMVSPEAAMKVDQDDLIKRLLGESDDSGGGNPFKKFDEIVNRMGSSAQLLDKKDPGEITQETQHRIVIDLDALIEEAQKQENKGGGGKSSGGKPGAMAKNTGSAGKQKGMGSGGTKAATDSTIRPGQDTANVSDQSLIDVRNDKWATLPPRLRDEITNGMKTDILQPYKTPMERFYDEIAKTNKPK